MANKIFLQDAGMQYLIALQEWRVAHSDGWSAFFSQATSYTGMQTILLIMACIYWAVDKRMGQQLLMGWNTGRLALGFFKIWACIYRPWILDARIEPDPKIKAGATGYSFPSGHSMSAAACFGGIAMQKETSRRFAILLVLIVLIVAFSRNFLSVHTPQDVVVGMALGFGAAWFGIWLFNKIEASDGPLDIIVAAVAVVLALLVAWFAATKQYPMDYDESGKILVEGQKMATDTYKAVGWTIGFFVSYVIERRFVKFTTAGTTFERLERLVFCLFLYYIYYKIIYPIFRGAFDNKGLGAAVVCFVEMVYIVLLAPIVIKFLQRKSEVAQAALAEGK